MQQITTRRAGQRRHNPRSREDVSGPPADLRRFWRILLAVVAPLPWLALALSNAITPDDLGSSTADTFASIAENPSAARAASVVGPGVLASRCSIGRRHDVGPPSNVAPTDPRNRRIRDVRVLLGPVEPEPQPDRTDHPRARPRHRNNDRAGIKLEEHPLAIIAIIPFFLTITIGRIGLGVLLWRARLAPRIVAVAMLAASPVEFLLVGASDRTEPRPSALLSS